jgi:hypothetical protein
MRLKAVMAMTAMTYLKLLIALLHVPSLANMDIWLMESAGHSCARAMFYHSGQDGLMEMS